MSLNRRTFLAATAATALGAPAARSLARPRAARRASGPNILFIISDDHRYDYFSFMGHPTVKTPAMDRLANEGAHCKNAFVTTSLCSPSRASIITGLYAHLHGVLDNGTLIPDQLPSYPVEMQRAGYDTAYIGKWHMGAHTDVARPGFTHWASFVGQGQYFDQSFNINGTRGVQKGHCTDAITGLTLDWLKTRKKDKPFCLCVGHKAPHEPFNPAPRFAKLYEGCPLPKPMPDDDEHYKTLPKWVRTQRNSWHGVDGMYDGRIPYHVFYPDYLRSITGVDDSIAQIIACVEELKAAQDTLVVYIGDNGFQVGEHGLIDKRTAYEASMRIPMLCYWPGTIAAGMKVSEQILNIDLPSLFLDAVGLKDPVTFQGQSFLPLLKKGSRRGAEPAERKAWRDAWFYEYFFERDFPQTPTVFAVRTPKWKWIESYGVWDPGELYDLEKDPGETTNLVKDPAYKDKVAEMKKLMDREAYHCAARRAPLWAAQGLTPDVLGHCEVPPWPSGDPPAPKGP